MQEQEFEIENNEKSNPRKHNQHFGVTSDTESGDTDIVRRRLNKINCKNRIFVRLLIHL